MVKIHGRDRSFEGTEEKMSDHPCCRNNRGRINRVALYMKVILNLYLDIRGRPVIRGLSQVFHGIE